jgi:hypothetical protein
MEISQLINALKFLNKCDYVSCKEKIVNKNVEIEAYKLKWDEKLVCQRRMQGGKGDHDNGSFNDNNYEEE